MSAEPEQINATSVPLLTGRSVVLGVTGSIAAYKACEVASRLVQAGAAVDVVMTRRATRFVTPLTFQSLVHRPVITDLFSLRSPTAIEHVALAKRAEVIVIAPATADVLARLAAGRADDALTATVLSSRCPLVIAPAMEEGMYAHPATQEHLAALRNRGAIVVPPETGRLASGATGCGRLAAPETIVGYVRMALGRQGDLAGTRLVVTAGGTREPLDPVRVLTNRSSGKMGIAVAHAARDRGADVSLISAAPAPADLAGIEFIPVQTAVDMLEAVREAVARRDTDALVMAAAVADYRPAAPKAQKQKKGADRWTVELVRNPDILAECRGDFLRVGFAAETEDVEANARRKLEEKQLDWIVANDVSRPDSGFDTDTNRVILFSRRGEFIPLPLMTKLAVADRLLDCLSPLLRARAAARREARHR